MVDRCAWTGRKVDKNTARITGVGTMLVALGLALTPLVWVAGLLAVDFLARATGNSRVSPLGRLSAWLFQLSRVAPQMVDAGPKRFAAWLGFGMATTIAVLAALGAHVPAQGLAIILAVCAGLEGVLGFCVGCTLYSMLTRAGVFKPERALR